MSDAWLKKKLTSFYPSDKFELQEFICFVVTSAEMSITTVIEIFFNLIYLAASKIINLNFKLNCEMHYYTVTTKFRKMLRQTCLYICLALFIFCFFNVNR